MNALKQETIVSVFKDSKEQALYTAKQVKSLESAYCEQHQIDSYQLMQRAGNSAWLHLQHSYPEANTIAVVVGPGNNGGDGFELAYLANRNGLKVILMNCYADKALTFTSDASLAYQNAMASGLTISPFSAELFSQCDVIVDAILGTGIVAPARTDIIQAIQQINHSAKPILSLDIPSGLEADSGSVIGLAIDASTTLTFIAIKPGLVTAEGKDHCGELFLADLDVYPKDFPEILDLETTTVRLSHAQVLTRCFPKRKHNVHKGQYGRIVIIGGNLGFGGAAILAAQAAYRTGAGAVSLITRPEHTSSCLSRIPEVMAIGVNNSDDPLAKIALEKATSLVIGPGLGKDAWAQYWLKTALGLKKLTLVDADGLSLAHDLHLDLSNTVITPHPGEAAYLLESSTEEIQQNRLQAAAKLQQLTGAIVVLKGSGTIVTFKSGQNLLQSFICPYGNPAMATAGMGDVLAGIIGTLLSQTQATDAALAGVILHALAGDQVAQRYPVGLLASDVVEALPSLIKNVQQN